MVETVMSWKRMVVGYTSPKCNQCQSQLQFESSTFVGCDVYIMLYNKV